MPSLPQRLRRRKAAVVPAPQEPNDLSPEAAVRARADGPMRRWAQYREQQLAALRESNRISDNTHHTGAHAAPSGHPVDRAVVPSTGYPATASDAGHDQEHGQDSQDDLPTAAHLAVHSRDGRDRSDSRYGPLGEALNRYSPFYLGFMAALGVATAYLLVGVLGRLQTTLTVLLVSLFLTLALNPIVEWIERRGIRRSGSVALVCLGMVGLFAILAWVVVPPLVSETTELVENAPAYAQSFTEQKWVQDLDRDYEIGDKLNEQVTKKSTDGAFVSQVFGGVLGAGKAVASGLFQGFTVLILTLYFLASLPTVKRAGYAMVPATRRPRVISLSEEIMRRTGSYALGQVAVATINGVCSWVMMTLLDIPYAAVLAVVVGFLGLIPMVGATLGAVIVVLVAFFVDPHKALVVGIYYLVYQQIENYVIVPRVMQRTVSVPGAVTVVAALAGGTLLGVLGALLAIPVAAGLLLLYEEVLVPKQSRA